MTTDFSTKQLLATAARAARAAADAAVVGATSDGRRGAFVGLGVDVVHLPRFRAMAQRPRTLARLSARILHAAERERFAAAGQHGDVRAADWALKESVFKALAPAQQPTFVMREWNTVAAPADAAGEPGDGQRARRPAISGPAGSPALLASVSHDGDYVVAVVVRQENA
ncbi:uncharacterized protein V1510DRAFT_367424 [Dipodascopsis tothii]|uniref:uncharacterized protein n=1 Tax=Dipodascopsis tothii TaxID=44089 RepID=UPI0034CE87B8